MYKPQYVSSSATISESSSFPPGASVNPSRPRIENGACDIDSMPPASTTFASSV